MQEGEKGRERESEQSTYEYIEEKHLDASFVCKCSEGGTRIPQRVGQFVQSSQPHFHINPQLFILLCIIEIDFVAEMDSRSVNQLMMQLR